MLLLDSGGAPQRQTAAAEPLTLYVEGPRDRSILRAWAQRLISQRATRVIGDAVILGGRQPLRALDHFERHLAGAPGARALCVLDRDDGSGAPPDPNGFDLEFFTWGRRHIESYLVVPAAIRRAIGIPAHDRRLERAIVRELPDPDDEPAWRELDAKRLLAPQGALTRVLGRPLPLSRIARATRADELHDDVHALLARVEALSQGGRHKSADAQQGEAERRPGRTKA